MKKFFLLGLILAAVGTARADWGTFEEPLQVFPMNTTIYGHTVSAGSDIAWSCIYESSADTTDPDSIKDNVYTCVLQGVKPDGSLVFPDGALRLSHETNLSFTMYNNYVYTDRDNNAIVMFCDLRNSDVTAREFSLYLWKVSPEGKVLWGGEEGLSPDGHARIPYLTATQCFQLEDGTYILAYQGLGTIYMQRISNDGKLMWGDKGKTINNAMYPLLINALDNQMIMVYQDGGVVKAMKYDPDGSEAWPNPAVIYSGGWGFTNTPSWAIIKAVPSGDGGALVSWYDDRKNKGFYTPYISYVTADGKLGFAGASDYGDCALTLSPMGSAVQVTAIPDPSGDGFIAAWPYNYNDGKNYGGLFMQRVDKHGELQWGEEGYALRQMSPDDSYHVAGICPGSQDQIGLFYCMDSKADGANVFRNCVNYLRIFNHATGQALEGKEQIALNEPTHIEGANAFTISDPKCWFLIWDRGIYSANDNVMLAQRIEYDGSMVFQSGVEETTVDNGLLEASFDGNALNIRSAIAATASVSVYDMAGKQVFATNAALANGNNQIMLDLQHGYYIARVNCGNSQAVCKIQK